MKKLWKFSLVALPLMTAGDIVLAAAPARLALALNGGSFYVYSIEYSDRGNQLCIAGTDTDDAGRSTGRIMLVDRANNALLWQKAFPVPDHHANVFPVQCRIADERVYLLAHVDTDSSPAVARTLTYLYSFGPGGKLLAQQPLGKPRGSQYGYAMVATPDGVKLAGYLRDQDENFDYYAIYTAAFDRDLKPRGDMLIRKNGAYTQFIGARITDDNLHIAGIFNIAKVGKKELGGEYAASRLRLAGGYAWSARTSFAPRSGVGTSVAENGTSHAVGYVDTTTTVLTVSADGKALPSKTYASRYCRTDSIAEYGSTLLAVREPCDGKDSNQVLVQIDPATGKENVMDWVADQPLHVAATATAWSVIAKAKDGKLYLYTSTSGAQ